MLKEGTGFILKRKGITMITDTSTAITSMTGTTTSIQAERKPFTPYREIWTSVPALIKNSPPFLAGCFFNNRIYFYFGMQEQ